MRRSRERDGGYAPVELAALVPLIGLLILTVVAAGRISAGRQVVQEAARDAARAASLTLTPAAARAAADQAARASLGAPFCPDFGLVLDSSNLSPPVGEVGRVVVTIICQVPLDDIVGLPLPARMGMSARAVAPVDRFRAR